MERMTRRKWLNRIGGTAVASALGTGLYAWRFEPHWVEVVRRKMAIPDLPASLQGRQLVQISVIHIGEYVNRALGYSVRVRFNARPEITVFTLERSV